MISFTLPTDFTQKHLDGVLRLNEAFRSKGTGISELYGALPSSPIGSGRDPFCVPQVGKEKLIAHVQACAQSGIEFNYLLNASCLGNEEFTEAGRKKIIQFLTFLSDAGVKRVTVALPYLGQLIKERLPHIKLSASVIAYIDSVDKARFFEQLGFDRITVDWDVNRNFKLLSAIRKSIRAELEVLTNSSCVLKCPMKQYHYNIESHRSREPVGDFWGINPCKQKCMQMLLEEPFRFLTSPFIRPEDVPYYASLGISFFKICGREYRSELLLNMARHFLNLRFEGNFVALLGAFMEPTEARRPLTLYIDNRKLDGFLEFFKKAYPCDLGCLNCMYCARYLEAVRIPYRTQKMARLYEQELRHSLYFDQKSKRQKRESFKQKLLSLQNSVLRKVFYKASGMIP